MKVLNVIGRFLKQAGVFIMAIVVYFIYKDLRGSGKSKDKAGKVSKAVTKKVQHNIKKEIDKLYEDIKAIKDKRSEIGPGPEK